MKYNKMPKLLEGILRETDRTDTMSNIASLGSAYKSGQDVVKNSTRAVDAELEPLIKRVIRTDPRSGTVDISFINTIDAGKKAQSELDKAQKNVRDQQEIFIKGIESLSSVKKLGGRIYLIRMQKDSLAGNGSVLTTSQSKIRYESTFLAQAEKLLAVIMGYASSNNWADAAVKAVKEQDKEYVKNFKIDKEGEEAKNSVTEVETSVRAFTTITGELYDRIQAVREKIEQRARILKK